MNILLEQEFDFSDFDKKANANVTTTPKSPTSPKDIKPIDKGDKDKLINKGDKDKLINKGDKDKLIDKGDKDTQLKKKDLNINTIYNSGFTPLLNNSIEFLKRFGPLTLKANFDEFAMYKLINTYIIRNNVSSTTLSLQYIDWIIRLATNGSDVNSLATKYQKQYNYILTQNGKRGTTLSLIFGIEKSPYLKTVNSIFNPKLPIGNALDMDSADAATIRSNVFRSGIVYTENNEESVFKKSRSAAELNKIILGGYNNGVYGQPLPQFKTKF